MFATAVMLAALVAFLLSTGPAMGTGPGLSVSSGGVAAVVDEPLLDIGQPMTIEKEIVVSEVGDDMLNYDVAIYNHSPADALRLDTLVDAELGNLDGRGSCSFPQVVQARSVYRCSLMERLSGG